MRAGSEDGWTLIELLVTVTVSLTILAAVLSLWSGAAANEKRNADRYGSIDNARTTLERMTRDVREAVAVTGITDRLVTLKVYKRVGATPTTLHTIAYNCGIAGTVAGTYRCVRTDTTEGTPGVTVIDGLSTPSVFTTTTGKPNLEMKLSARIKGAVYPVVLQSAASPRNCTGALSACVGP